MLSVIGEINLIEGNYVIHNYSLDLFRRICTSTIKAYEDMRYLEREKIHKSIMTFNSSLQRKYYKKKDPPAQCKYYKKESPAHSQK